MVAMYVLFLSHFPPRGSELIEEEAEPEVEPAASASDEVRG